MKNFTILTIVLLLFFSFIACVSTENIPPRNVGKVATDDRLISNPVSATKTDVYERESVGDCKNGILRAPSEAPEYVGEIPDEMNGKILVHAFIEKLQAYDCLNDSNKDICTQCMSDNNNIQDCFSGTSATWNVQNKSCSTNLLKTWCYSDVFKFNSGNHCNDPKSEGIGIQVSISEAVATTPEGYLGCLLLTFIYESAPTSPVLYESSVADGSTSIMEPRPGYLSFQGSQCKPNTDYWFGVYGLDIRNSPPYDFNGYSYTIEFIGRR